ncbi:hypothetical protein NQ318_017473 [Aromia moschata]|uniref:Uncharacterized protein n=1 Tax=Aromia moschata TaxID=1265417 RepID=A0AAV8Z2M4_9CUCU|nr:hypothetical protein NQ318_017473 [Aromia moschata]
MDLYILTFPAFDKRDKHHYAKLVPEAYGDTNSLQEGEGDLTTADQRSESDLRTILPCGKTVNRENLLGNPLGTRKAWMAY